VKRDAAIAAALFAASVVELLLRDADELGLQLTVSAVLTAAVVLRQTRLFAALGLQVAGFLVLAAADQEPAASGAIIPLLICLFTAGAFLPGGRGVAALALVAAGVFVQALTEEDIGDAVYVTLVFVIPPWIGGRLMGSRRRQVAALELLHAELAAEHERAEGLAAEAERGRIAREMHDVLSHGMSLMVLQAGAGPRLLESDRAAAREAFRSIRQTGERARAELDAALIDRSPETSLGELVAAVPGARLRTQGDVETLPAGVRLAVQRIVQEGLTNAVKHGRAQAITVEVACDDGAVDVLVADDGGPGATGLPGSGRGLPGMRERAAAYGGTLHAGPRAMGGFEVRARIPAHPR
jgi:signal transduction histidine kinase